MKESSQRNSILHYLNTYVSDITYAQYKLQLVQVMYANKLNIIGIRLMAILNAANLIRSQKQNNKQYEHGSDDQNEAARIDNKLE